jgi:hypothetical protein
MIILNENIGPSDYHLDFYQFKPFLLWSQPDIIREQTLNTRTWAVVSGLSQAKGSMFVKGARTKVNINDVGMY